MFGLKKFLEKSEKNFEKGLTVPNVGVIMWVWLRDGADKEIRGSKETTPKLNY
jgi:hypothetical protein